MTLRIHKGRPHSLGSGLSQIASLGAVSHERMARFATTQKTQDVEISVSFPSTDSLPAPNNSSLYAVRHKVNGKETTVSYLEKKERDLSAKNQTKIGKSNLKNQAKRFRMETKAAKTLAIIVGGFIICWCPFFTMYLIRAFCEECIPSLLFSVMFWLGYCNSAINPVIYALFSKDFRFAFKKIICRFFCPNHKFIKFQRRGSDASQTKNRHSPCITPATTPHNENKSVVNFR